MVNRVVILTQKLTNSTTTTVDMMLEPGNSRNVTLIAAVLQSLGGWSCLRHQEHNNSLRPHTLYTSPNVAVDSGPHGIHTAPHSDKLQAAELLLAPRAELTLGTQTGILKDCTTDSHRSTIVITQVSWLLSLPRLGKDQRPSFLVFTASSFYTWLSLLLYRGCFGNFHLHITQLILQYPFGDWGRMTSL